MAKEKRRIHPELLKLYTSPNYRKKIKNIVESFRLIQPNLRKLPGKLQPLKATASEKERDEHAKMVSRRLTRSSAHYWAQAYEAGSDRNRN